MATAEEALETAQEVPPELALIDIRLVGSHDGIWLARSLRDRCGLPALFLSGQTTQARAARDAALDLLGKPYNPDEVVEAVATVGELLVGRAPSRCRRRPELFGQA